jgi:D-lactate dehydrogenase
LPSGLLIDSADPRASEKLRTKAPALFQEILGIKAEIEASPALVGKIRRKYRIKNTMGYGLNSFLDYRDPVEILSHLMIGSEGTLGFIAEAVLETLPDPRFKATALLAFDSIHAACMRIAEFQKSGAQAIELMDQACLKASGSPHFEGKAAALLLEYHFETEEERALALPELRKLLFAKLETDPVKQQELWKIRKGALPSIGATRASGTTVIIEDIAVPMERLADAVSALRGILDQSGYQDGVIFGHAKDGNLHFVIAQSLNDPESIERYTRLMEDVASMVTERFEGSLKAEHGTGRNMAPFVELEWGTEAYGIMKRIKSALDPDLLLNPGVILSDDPRANVKDLKFLPQVDPETDRCMECGFCESKCPSQNLTLSPRQRIAVRREMARSVRDPEICKELERAFQYSGIDTCAADGMCATACPVDIDTGALIKRLREEAHSEQGRKLAVIFSHQFFWLEKTTSLLLRIGLAFRVWVGDRWIRKLTRFWSPWFRATKPLSPQARGPSDYIYFSSCVNRTIGGDLPKKIAQVSARAGKRIRLPKGAQGHCCGTPFYSKGFHEAGDEISARTLNWLWEESEEGKIPVLMDQSPCTQTLKQEALKKHPGFRILDSIELASELLPLLRIRKKPGPIALHPTCSTLKMGMRSEMEEIARRCSQEVFVPASLRCCGFAGDRGFLFPELTRSATKEQAQEISEAHCSGYYSTSTTCEIALSQATGKPYQSIWHLLEEVSRE